ncbi:microneme protein MIC12 [Besnoitia besnoiti]|uniref:Microneme protein MIC12 n=1 Tax=Besnoitia besnoiti TaxID=94643 RepID=A0A2A9MH12_BESBE|nr:microneme protein MIC12 [Besnoitia besnoiti]PFH34692.1 microneme protein MIC12 [Besnoitia besnoiti]
MPSTQLTGCELLLPTGTASDPQTFSAVPTVRGVRFAEVRAADRVAEGFPRSPAVAVARATPPEWRRRCGPEHCGRWAVLGAQLRSQLEPPSGRSYAFLGPAGQFTGDFIRCRGSGQPASLLVAPPGHVKSIRLFKMKLTSIKLAAAIALFTSCRAASLPGAEADLCGPDSCGAAGTYVNCMIEGNERRCQCASGFTVATDDNNLEICSRDVGMSPPEVPNVPGTPEEQPPPEGPGAGPVAPEELPTEPTPEGPGAGPVAPEELPTEPTPEGPGAEVPEGEQTESTTPEELPTEPTPEGPGAEVPEGGQPESTTPEELPTEPTPEGPGAEVPEGEQPESTTPEELPTEPTPEGPGAEVPEGGQPESTTPEELPTEPTPEGPGAEVPEGGQPESTTPEELPTEPTPEGPGAEVPEGGQPESTTPEELPTVPEEEDQVTSGSEAVPPVEEGPGGMPSVPQEEVQPETPSAEGVDFADQAVVKVMAKRAPAKVEVQLDACYTVTFDREMKTVSVTDGNHSQTGEMSGKPLIGGGFVSLFYHDAEKLAVVYDFEEEDGKWGNVTVEMPFTTCSLRTVKVAGVPSSEGFEAARAFVTADLKKLISA